MPRTNAFPVYFLINQQTHLLDMAGPCQAFHESNERGGQFDLHFVSFDSNASCYQGLTLSQLQPPPAQLPGRAIVVVCASKYQPGVYTDDAAVKSAHWLRTAPADDTLILGICTGTFLLGRAGLLDHRQCTTHHSLTAELAEQYPRAKVIADRIYLQDGHLFTSAGVTAGIDLCLALIEQLSNGQCATEVARELVVHRRRMANDPQLSLHVRYRNHVSPLVHAVQDYIANHYRQHLSTTVLSQHFRVSQRHLQRLFKEYTGVTMKEYITRIRLEEAKNLLDDCQTIEQAAYLSGFSQPSTFRAAWKKYFGGLPGECRQG
ncbi:AraC family transcriptional regulator [Bacterioplanes sanyensis]|uniref:GlxA family transcriptional regulator n=1 Tax=Bacterioplanes sanyensis TaxID=1249553 RepID=UPI001674856E|nr:helix-turn-helix domain-containing protein [Bacterioplanes sanyensis]GGY55605.1 AraC family transcriptional regulator [Bacterioplanes sanyensis]